MSDVHISNQGHIRGWIILGKNGCRKGSTIRALSGISRDKDYDITFQNGQSIRIWSRISSINESNDRQLPNDWISGFKEYRTLVKCVEGRERSIDVRYQNFLVAIRLDLGLPGYEAFDYINKFSSIGVTIESIVTLGEPTRDWVKDFGVPYADVVDVSVPTNLIAHQVRTFWGWR